MRPRRQEWGTEIVRVEEVSMCDVAQLRGDPWIEELRKAAGWDSDAQDRAKRIEDPTRPFSKIKKPVEVVWEICSKMPTESRDVQIAACVAAGVNIHTARTQQSKWANRFKSKS